MRWILLALALLPAIPSAPAHGSWSHCGASDVTVADQYYLVPGLMGSRIYQEANGMSELQRGPGASLAGVAPDSCDECEPLPFVCSGDYLVA
jgi:hypothetical protein